MVWQGGDMGSDTSNRYYTIVYGDSFANMLKDARTGQRQQEAERLVQRALRPAPVDTARGFEKTEADQLSCPGLENTCFGCNEAESECKRTEMHCYVDGLTVAQCLERYTAWQRADYGYGRKDGWNVYKLPLQSAALTEPQLAAAKQAWSTELKRKQSEVKQRERVRVVCDDDRWEP